MLFIIILDADINISFCFQSRGLGLWNSELKYENCALRELQKLYVSQCNTYPFTELCDGLTHPLPVISCNPCLL